MSDSDSEGGSWEDDDFTTTFTTDAVVEEEEEAEETEQPDVTTWFATKTTPPTTLTSTQSNHPKKTPKEDNRPPLLLVDFTVLSQGKLHNKFDANSVNDPDLKRKMTQQCTTNFIDFRDNVELVQKGTIRSCGQSVWREALQELRRDFPGHFWAPIFPPTNI